MIAARRVAIVHDWLTGMRGGEKVLEVLCERFPDAELFTLVHVRGSVSPIIERRPIHVSALSHLPGVGRYYRHCLPMFPTLIERFNLDAFDLVISSSHCVAKSALARPDAVHVCYCHTPMRYAWDQFDAYFGPERLGWAGSRTMRLVMNRLARWDRETAHRPNRYLTNSQHVASRIGRYYNRVAKVVYPPVDTQFFTPGSASAGRFALIVSALAPYKRVDVAIAACAQAGVPLKIVGSGPERASLERTASGEVEFLGRQPDEAIRDLYRSAAMVLLPGEEDFGIVPLEAQACGRPVVALGRGGALETVIDGETGVLVPDAGAEALAGGIARALTCHFDRGTIRRHAEGFGRDRFGDQVEAEVGAAVASGATVRV